MTKSFYEWDSISIHDYENLFKSNTDWISLIQNAGDQKFIRFQIFFFGFWNMCRFISRLASLIQKFIIWKFPKSETSEHFEPLSFTAFTWCSKRFEYGNTLDFQIMDAWPIKVCSLFQSSQEKLNPKIDF